MRKHRKAVCSSVVSSFDVEAPQVDAAISSASSVASVNITVCTISGTSLQMCVNDTVLGQDVLDSTLTLLPRHTGIGIAKLLHGSNRIDMSRPVLNQGVTDGADLTLVWVSIEKQQQQAVVEKMLAGRDIDGEYELDVLNSITELAWSAPFLDNLILPTRLQSLTF